MKQENFTQSIHEKSYRCFSRCSFMRYSKERFHLEQKTIFGNGQATHSFLSTQNSSIVSIFPVSVGEEYDWALGIYLLESVSFHNTVVSLQLT